jgi:hypothetical protein
LSPANLATSKAAPSGHAIHRHQAQCMARIGSGIYGRDPHEPRGSEHLRPALIWPPWTHARDCAMRGMRPRRIRTCAQRCPSGYLHHGAVAGQRACGRRRRCSGCFECCRRHTPRSAGASFSARWLCSTFCGMGSGRIGAGRPFRGRPRPDSCANPSSLGTHGVGCSHPLEPDALERVPIRFGCYSSRRHAHDSSERAGSNACCGLVSPRARRRDHESPTSSVTWRLSNLGV